MSTWTCTECGATWGSFRIRCIDCDAERHPDAHAADASETRLLRFVLLVFVLLGLLAIILALVDFAEGAKGLYPR